MRTGRLVWLACLATLSGCGEEAAQLVAMRIELNALKQEMEYLRYQTEDLDPRVRSAEQMALQSIDEREAPLRLDCVEHRPGVVTTRLAPVTAVCEDVEAVDGGHRVRLKIGNPTSGRLDGLHLTLYAGAGAPDGRSETRLHHQVEMPLAPGAWQTVAIDVPELPASAFRQIAVRAQLDGIVLAQR